MCRWEPSSCPQAFIECLLCAWHPKPRLAGIIPQPALSRIPDSRNPRVQALGVGWGRSDSPRVGLNPKGRHGPGSAQVFFSELCPSVWFIIHRQHTQFSSVDGKLVSMLET